MQSLSPPPLSLSPLHQVHGKVGELSNHHTASRIIQFCARYGNEEQRKAITDEVGAQGVGWVGAMESGGCKDATWAGRCTARRKPGAGAGGHS